MKCPHCGGSVVWDLGHKGQPDQLKCIHCTRDPRKHPNFRFGHPELVSGSRKIVGAGFMPALPEKP
jgi:hypothetical protein